MYVYEPGHVLNSADMPESIFLLDPYIPQESVVILYGRPSLGKTPLAWQIAQAIQLGQPLWGFPVQQTNVLFLELDMPRSLARERWRNADPEFRPEFVACFDDQSIDCVQFLSSRPDERHQGLKHTFLALHTKYKFGLVCVDALREVVIGDLSPSGAPRRIYDAFHAVFPGASTLFIHHERKQGQNMFGPGDPLQSSAGSMEFMNVAQVAIHMHKIGKETFLSHPKSQASIQFEPLPLTIHEDGVHFTNRHEDRQQKALSVMQSVMKARPDIAMRELDAEIGKALGLSARSARIIRAGLVQCETQLNETLTAQKATKPETNEVLEEHKFE